MNSNEKKIISEKILNYAIEDTVITPLIFKGFDKNMIEIVQKNINVETSLKMTHENLMNFFKNT